MKHMRLMGDHEAIADCMTEINTLKKLRDNPCIVTLRYPSLSLKTDTKFTSLNSHPPTYTRMYSAAWLMNWFCHGQPM